MKCEIDIKIISVDTVEYGVQSFPEGMENWRCFRIEYGGCNEDCLAEGHIWLPPEADPQQLEMFLMGMQAYHQIWKTVN